MRSLYCWLWTDTVEADGEFLVDVNVDVGKRDCGVRLTPYGGRDRDKRRDREAGKPWGRENQSSPRRHCPRGGGEQ